MLVRTQFRLVRPARQLAVRSELQGRIWSPESRGVGSSLTAPASVRTHGAQLAVSHLRRLQLTYDALTLAVGIIDDHLDRVEALDRAAGRHTTPSHELGQLCAQAVIERLVKAHPHQATLVWSQTEPTVTENRDMHAPADQPTRAIRATQAAAPISAKRAYGGRREVDARYPARIAPGVRRDGAQSNRDMHDGLLFCRLGKR